MLEMESAEQVCTIPYPCLGSLLGTFRDIQILSASLCHLLQLSIIPLSTDVSAQLDSGEGCSWLGAGAL